MQSIVIRQGHKIVGTFQVAGLEPQRGRMVVSSVLVFPSRSLPGGKQGEKEVFLFGWFRGERGGSKLVAMNARCWTAIEWVTSVRSSAPRGNWFITPDREAFAFIEDVPPGEEASARALGGRSVEEVVVEEYVWRADKDAG